jgi:hypothetical protein
MKLNSRAQTCPHCDTSLVARKIPQQDRHLYLPPGVEDDGRFLFYSRVVGMSSLWFDRILAYKCPFCEAIDVVPGCESMWAQDLAGERPENGQK